MDLGSTIRKMQLVLSLLLICLCVDICQSQQQQVTCSSSQKAEAEAQHERCVATIEGRREATGPARLASLCQRLHDQVYTCGEYLAKCLSPEDLRVVKDAEISAFIKFLDAQSSGYLYRDCEVVKEFQRSNRKPFKETQYCKLDELEKVIQKREDCVRRETDIMRNKMGSVNPGNEKYEKTNILCDFVDKSINSCSWELQRCYSDYDYQSLLQQSYNMLGKVLSKFGSDFRLTDCTALSTPVPLSEALGAAGTMGSMSAAAIFAISTFVAIVAAKFL